MPIKFLLPNPFKLAIKDLIEHQYIRKLRKRNRIYSIISGLISAITLIAIFYFIPYARTNHLFTKEDREAILTAIYLVLIVVVFCSGFECVSTGYTASKMPKLSSHFRVKQTGFYIDISNETLELLSKYYLCNKETKSRLDFNQYSVYTDIYDEMSGDTTRYFMGQMRNGQLMSASNYNKYCKLATTDMITIINNYALYIKKHHLENIFADSATLRFSTKYLDKDYKPMLIMTNKDNEVLHLKQNSNMDAENVVFTN